MRLRNIMTEVKEQYLEKLKSLYLKKGWSEKSTQKVVAYAENLLSLGLPVIMSRKHLSRLLGVPESYLCYMLRNIETNFYHVMHIPKKSGGEREIQAPAMELKQIQKWILKNVLEQLPVSEYAMGFRKDKSIVTNAEQHKGKHCVVNMDLKDFFPSIDRDRVFRIFYYYGYSTEVSYVLSRLCTCKDKMPQGAPTSPYLSNVVCLRLDKRLGHLAEKFHAQYSRYADDITFSADSDIKTIVKPAEGIIGDEGFTVNEKKTRIAYNYERQEVTGIVVNGDCVTVPKGYRKKLLQEIYYCKKYGVYDHCKHIGNEKMFFREHMYGKAYFVYMVDPALGSEILQKLGEIDWDS